jgi:predicted RNA binding protein YcfA (HicA-like mRNA interferase family)
MKAAENLVNKFLNNKMHITVGDCDKLLVYFGYKRHKRGGSHQTYHKKGAAPITVITPKNTKYVNSAYVQLIIKYLKLGE